MNNFAAARIFQIQLARDMPRGFAAGDSSPRGSRRNSGIACPSASNRAWNFSFAPAAETTRMSSGSQALSASASRADIHLEFARGISKCATMPSACTPVSVRLELCSRGALGNIFRQRRLDDLLDAGADLLRLPAFVAVPS
jgi:hypothetical protein